MARPRPTWRTAWMLVALVLAGCSSRPVVELPLGETIRLGTVLSLTGSLAPEGQLTKEGYLFWQDWINARGGLELKGFRHRLQIQIEDDESRPSLSAERTERLLSQGQVKLLLGPSAGLATDRSASVAQQHQIPMVAANADPEALYSRRNPFLFGVVGPAGQRLRALIDLALTLDPRPETAAILFADDSLSTEVAATARDYAAGRGLAVVVYARYPSGTNNLRRQLTRVAEADPDLLLVSGHSDESISIIKQARELNAQPRLIGFTDGPGSEEFVSGLQKDAEYVFGVSHWTPLAKTQGGGFLSNGDYLKEFTDKFGHPPDWRSAAATAACLALTAAIRKAGSVEPGPVREALAGLDVDSFFARLRFDERGANVYRPTYVEQIQNGSRALVWPAEAATARPRYPAPAWSLR